MTQTADTTAAHDAPRGASERMGMVHLPVTAVTPSDHNPRSAFDPDAHADLQASIRHVGLLQPIVVRPTGEGTWMIIAGERRYRAVCALGWETIPAIVRQADGKDAFSMAVLENVVREGLNSLEEAAAYVELMDVYGMSQTELARKLGLSRQDVGNTVRLLSLPPEVQVMVAAGVLSKGHAKVLLSWDGQPDRQLRLAKRIRSEMLTVRQAAEVVAGRDDGFSNNYTEKDRTPVRRRAPAELSAVAADLADVLDTRVRVLKGSGRGRIIIDFADAADLNRVVELVTRRRTAETDAQDG